MSEIKRTSRGRFKKGVSGNPTGRPKGRKSSGPAAIYEAVMRVFELKGGVQGLAKWAMENPTAFYRDTMPKYFPQRVMQEILMQAVDKDIYAKLPQIVFQSVEVPQLEARVEQLETLLKEKKIALPKAEPLKELPESVPERTSEGISLQEEGTDQDKKLLPEKTSEKKVPEIAPKRQLSAAERLRLRQAQEDSESWAVTKDD